MYVWAQLQAARQELEELPQLLQQAREQLEVERQQCTSHPEHGVPKTPAASPATALRADWGAGTPVKQAHTPFQQAIARHLHGDALGCAVLRSELGQTEAQLARSVRYPVVGVSQIVR